MDKSVLNINLNRGDGPDYLTAHDLRGVLGRRTLARLLRHADLYALDGSACWSAEALADLLHLARLEGGRW
jgi:hypothetical protein